MSDQARTYSVINLFDWTKGVMDRSDNPLAVFGNSLILGENVDTSGYGLRSRYGSSPVSGFARGATVRFMTSVYLPTSRSNYLIAQVEEPSGVSRIFVARLTNPAAISDAVWHDVYNLGQAAQTICVACLNDRVLITEGKNHRPIVFAGCLDDSGSDWAVPKAAMVTYNNGLDWDDITDAVCDSDPETEASTGIMNPDSWVAVCCDTPLVQSFWFDLSDGASISNVLITEGYTGVWEAKAGWTDGTHVLGRTGVVNHLGSPFRASYHSLNNVPGFWFRFRFATEHPGANIRRILFRCPCQELSVIGDGLAQAPLGFLYHDESENSLKDFTVEVSDYAYPTFARLNDGMLDKPTAMSSQDSIFIGYLTRFSSVELTVHNDFGNKMPASLSGSYWDGAGWKAMNNFSDTTCGSGGETLAMTGLVSWEVPDDWKHNRPINQQQSHGYWIRLKVSASLSPKTYITEAAVTPVMDRLKKSRLAITVRDRAILLGRSDAPDQIDISRPLEEYGFSGEESASFRIGGQGEITAAVEAFNQGFIAKSDDWYLLNGYSPSTFSVERAEASGQTPVNSRVIVRAPHAESDMKNLMGLYYINRSGAWYFAGLKVYRISEGVSWWDDCRSGGYTIDRDSLDSACGLYMPDKNRVVWSVPMNVGGLGSGGRNNRLIIYDLNTKSWMGPYTMSLSALTAVSGRVGPTMLIGADYSGRVLRLFDPLSSDDSGEPVKAEAQTQWLNFGAPHMEKRLRSVTLIGQSLSAPVHIDIFTDGMGVSSASLEFQGLLTTGNGSFKRQRLSLDVAGRFFRFSFKFQAPTVIHGLHAGFSTIREWGLN